MTPLKKRTDREEERAGGRMDERKKGCSERFGSVLSVALGLRAPDLVHIFAIVAMF